MRLLPIAPLVALLCRDRSASARRRHACSGLLGAWLASEIRPKIINWAVVASFVVTAVWILITNKLRDADAVPTTHSIGVLGTTVLAFSVLE
ncbi:hypothetical protein LMG28727_07147 [Paraburkholderia kirstenboschensis]|nr:hypothetical protein LMG28727_07147 [Paraburkholderia kirstenboschensis]